MLVLTRKQDEAIRIGDDIVIKIVATDKNSVRIGI
ncbi:carbon storage regulator, partial [Hydrogenimonas sp.]